MLPNDHWVFNSFKELKKVRLLRGMDEDLAEGHEPYLGRGGPSPATRYSVADGSYTTTSLLRDKANDLERDCKLPSLLPPGQSATEAFNKATAELKSRNGYVYGGQVVIPIIDFSSKQLKELGGDSIEMKTTVRIAVAKLQRAQVTQPGSALVQFRDVRKDHWAASAILELRSKGLLNGYPECRSW